MFVNPYTFFFFNTVTHIALVVFVFTASLLDAIFLFTMYFLMRCCGISMLYHRHYAHSAWMPPAWFKIPGTFFACLSGEGTPVSWTAWHLTHHRYSDTEKDPHSPIHRGKLYCWFLPMFANINIKFGARLTRDPVAMWFHKWFWFVHLAWLLTLLALYPYGVISLYLAPAALTWALGTAQNVYSHLYGTRAYNTNDASKNNWINGLIGFGEGWHNNHHHNPTHYRHGIKNNQLDLGAWLIEKIVSRPQLIELQKTKTHSD